MEKPTNKEELSKLQTERTLSDAELLKGGAKYVTDSEGSEPRLEITDQQYEKILQEMEEITSLVVLARLMEMPTSETQHCQLAEA